MAEGLCRQQGCAASCSTRFVKKWLPLNSIIKTETGVNDETFHHGITETMSFTASFLSVCLSRRRGTGAAIHNSEWP